MIRAEDGALIFNNLIAFLIWGSASQELRVETQHFSPVSLPLGSGAVRCPKFLRLYAQYCLFIPNANLSCFNESLVSRNSPSQNPC